MSNVVPLKAGGQIAPIIPKDLDEIGRLANGIAKSGLAPRSMDKPEQIAVAIMTGLEIGLPPMFSIQKIAVINGRPAIWGDAVPALLWAKNFKLREWVEGEVAHCEVTRPDGTKIERTFSIAQAKQAGLWGKAGPWTQYRDRMLQMRARGYACRDGAPDVLSGMYLAEELEEDRPMRDVTPRKAAVLEIPDIPSQEPLVPTEAEASQDVPDDDTLADPEGYLEKLAESIALCTSAEDLAEVVDANEYLIERLPTRNHKERARKMLKDAEDGE